MELFIITLGLIASYLIGSISSGIITCKLLQLPDPRDFGSKNPGATNVLRSGNKRAAIFTLIGDTVKGVIPVLIAKELGTSATVQSLVMLAAFIGHLYPVFFKFQGGKGVATALGGLLAISLPLGLLTAGTWFLTAVLFRYSSLAAIVATLLTPLYTYAWFNSQWLFAISIMSLFLLWRHRGNITRLAHGEESRIRFKKNN